MMKTTREASQHPAPSQRLLALDAYAPVAFLDALKDKLRLKNDAALARQLEIGTPIISKIRNRRIGISSLMVLRAHVATGIAVAELFALMGLTVEQGLALG